MNSLTAVLRSLLTDHPARLFLARGAGVWDCRFSRATLAGAIVAFGMFYGAVMGTYGGFIGVRMWQVLYSAVKVPFLLFATFLLSLPSFFVINTLLGLRADFPRVVCALLATQAGLTIILSASCLTRRSGMSAAAATSPRSCSTA